MADGVSATDAFNVGRMFSAPLAPYAQTGTNQVNLASVSSGVAALTGLSFLSSPNPIIQTVDPNNLTITNVAIAPHVFTGSVQIKWTHWARQFFREFKLHPFSSLQLVGAAPFSSIVLHLNSNHVDFSTAPLAAP